MRWTHGSDVCWRNQKSVHNSKIMFSADDQVLIKFLRQEKSYDAKKFIAEFTSKPWTVGHCQD